MFSTHTNDSTRQNSWIRDGYRIDAKEHTVTKTTTGLLSGKLPEDIMDFPSHYYPSAFQKTVRGVDTLPLLAGSLSPEQTPPRINGRPPRNATKVNPMVNGNNNNYIPAISQHQQPLLKPAPVTVNVNNNVVPAIVPIVPSPAKPIVHVSPKPVANYAEMVAAKPKVITRYGDYPELRGDYNFAPGAPIDRSPPGSLSGFGPQPVSPPAPPPRRMPQKLRSTFSPATSSAQPLGPFGVTYLEQQLIEDSEPNATMETTVSGQSDKPKRVGRWTLAQLRQTDGIIPSQAGWNKGDSQKLMTNFGTPRNTATRVKAENLQEVPEEVLLRSHGEVRLQSGSNKFASQKGQTGFGAPRDVCREGVRVNQLPSDLEQVNSKPPYTNTPFSNVGANSLFEVVARPPFPLGALINEIPTKRYRCLASGVSPPSTLVA
uniref:ZM domain-containing protein n=1 Tax=Panagrellus redivivus TaxID=6233 RepID=A0A7E4WBT7_PANRE